MIVKKCGNLAAAFAVSSIIFIVGCSTEELSTEISPDFSEDLLLSDSLLLSDTESKSLSLTATDEGLQLLFRNVHDYFNDVSAVLVDQQDATEVIYQGIATSEVTYEQTAKGVVLSVPFSTLDQIALDSATDLVNIDVELNSGESIYFDAITEESAASGAGMARSLPRAVIWVGARVWTGARYSYRWVRKTVSGALAVRSVSFGHGARHITQRYCGFSGTRSIIRGIQRAIKSDMKRRASRGDLPDVARRGQYPTISYKGRTIEYKPYKRSSSGRWHVGTYYCK